MKITFFPISTKKTNKKRRGTFWTSSALVVGTLLSGQQAFSQQNFGSFQAPPNVSTQKIENTSIFRNQLKPMTQTQSRVLQGNIGNYQPSRPTGQFQTGTSVPTNGSFQRSVQVPTRTASLANIRTNGTTTGNTNLSEVKLRSIGSASFLSVISTTLGDHLKGSVVNSNLVKIELPGNILPALPAAFGGNGQPQTLTATLYVDRLTDSVRISGDPSLVSGWTKIIKFIDSPQYKAGIRRVIYTDKQTRQRVVAFLDRSAILESHNENGRQYKLLASRGRSGAGQFPGLATQTAYQQDKRPGQLPNNQQKARDAFIASQPGTAQQKQELADLLQNLTIRIDPVTGNLVLEGTDRDIRLFKQYLNKLSDLAMANAPKSDVIQLTHANAQVVARDVQTLYDQAFQSRFGPASITAVERSNVVMISGSKDAISTLRTVIEKLDIKSPVEGNFQTFHLKYANASNVADRLANFFRTQAAQPGGNAGGGGNNQDIGSGVLIIPDNRANLIIFKGAPSQLEVAEKLVKQIDIIDIKSEKDVKIIPLKNSDAATMAEVLRNAIGGAIGGKQPNQQITINNQGFGNFQQPTQAGQDPATASSMLKLRTFDPTTGALTSGIMTDVQIVPDPIGNTLVITAPEESMPLIEMLVKQLDRLPTAETQIKVFFVKNGDAEQMFTMLQELFLQSQNQQNGGGFGGFSQNTQGGLDRLPLQSGARDTSLVNLRFALERRTNSIVASGSKGDLTVVEDLISHLDRNLTHRYQTHVLRLSNAPSEDTANTIRAWAEGRDDLVSNDPTTSGAAVAAKKRVVIQEDIVHGHLIITATPEDYAEIQRIVEVLDRRPSMVAIEVMIAEVRLDDVEEFGLEFGIQDSLLFDRGIGNNIGFNFNQGGIGNSLNAQGLATREALGGQALLNLNMGRVSSQTGYGGMVLSAGNESVSLLMRALKDKQRVRVLSRPQVMAIDLLQSRIQVGQRVPYLTSINNNNLGNTNNSVGFQNVGIILEVVPRVSPDGVITMLVNTTNSSLGNQADGIVVSTDQQGNAIRQPIINTTESISTVIARSGQTVVLGGLIRTSKSYSKRGMPILSDLPRLGPLFSFQSEVEERSELLIFMTPKIIDHDDALTEWNQTEMERMNWCAQDVLSNSNVGYSNQGRFDATSGPQVVYPGIDPTGQGIINPIGTESAPGVHSEYSNQYPVNPTSLLQQNRPVEHAARAEELPEATPAPEKPSLIQRTFQKVFQPTPRTASKPKQGSAKN